MQDLKRSRKRFVKPQVKKNNKVEEIEIEDMDRGCKSCSSTSTESTQTCSQTTIQDFECEEVLICQKPTTQSSTTCEACQPESDFCQDNGCETGCCGPIMPQKFSTSNSLPYAIEVDRIYDTMKFQSFTDASGPRNSPLYFRYDVVEVSGDIPQRSAVNIKINKVCMNYSGIEVIPGNVSLENRSVIPLSPVLISEDDSFENPCPGFEDISVNDVGQLIFEYSISGNSNPTCCSQGQGEKVGYKEKGLKVRVYDLVLELEGKCGCTDVVVLAYPSIKSSGNFVDANYVEFNFNTLSSTMCLPANGKQVNLRQQYQTALKVECIGKTLLRLNDSSCDEEYEFCIPNGIDLVCCLEEVISALISEQIVVLGSSRPITPRVVDTFSKVCDFSSCGDE